MNEPTLSMELPADERGALSGARGRVLGLTGPAASGKSFVADMLARRYACRIFDADKEARALSEREDMRRGIRALCPRAAKADGGVDRGALREAALADPALLRALEAALYPELTEAARRFAEDVRREGGCGAIDAPLLRRAGLDALCDVVIRMSVDPALRRSRLLSRPGMTPALADALDAAQADVLLCHNPEDIVINGALSPLRLAEELDRAFDVR